MSGSKPMGDDDLGGKVTRLFGDQVTKPKNPSPDFSNYRCIEAANQRK